MKLATLPYNDGDNPTSSKRDGRLVVVSDDLQLYTDAQHIAPNLQSALDNWKIAQPQLQELANQLNNQSVTTNNQPFIQQHAMAPLPRAYAWADGSAYVNHVELVRKARGAAMPESFWHDPLMYQGGSDDFLAPYAPITVADENWGIDMEAEIAVIIDDVPMGADYQTAKQAILLMVLVNDVSLRGLIKDELAKGFGFFHSKPSSALSPVAVTLDTLGDAWDGAKLHLPMRVDLNDAPLGRVHTGKDMVFDMPRLIMHAAKTRHLSAGSIIGSGTISNKSDADESGNQMGKPVNQGGAGYACLAELRMIETILYGAPKTPFMRFGDKVTINMQDDAGNNIFGTIEQIVENYQPS